MSLYGYHKKTNPAPWMAGVRNKPALKRNLGYAELARQFIDAHSCSVCPVYVFVPELMGYHEPPTEIHHIYGRGYGGRGPLLMDMRFWLAVSRRGHQWIDSHRHEAIKFGWLAPAGHYNTPVPLDSVVIRNRYLGVTVER